MKQLIHLKPDESEAEVVAAIVGAAELFMQTPEAFQRTRQPFLTGLLCVYK